MTKDTSTSKSQDSTPSVDLDLSTLVQAKKRVKMPDGNIIEIAPPALETLLKVAKIGADMQEVQGNLTELDEQKAIDLYANLTKAFKELVPELADADLNYEQTFALLDLVVQMAMPSDLKELEKRGITLSTDQKKILQNSVNKSPTS